MFKFDIITVQRILFCSSNEKRIFTQTLIHAAPTFHTS